MWVQLDDTASISCWLRAPNKNTSTPRGVIGLSCRLVCCILRTISWWCPLPVVVFCAPSWFRKREATWADPFPHTQPVLGGAFRVGALLEIERFSTQRKRGSATQRSYLLLAGGPIVAAPPPRRVGVSVLLPCCVRSGRIRRNKNGTNRTNQNKTH